MYVTTYKTDENAEEAPPSDGLEIRAKLHRPRAYPAGVFF